MEPIFTKPDLPRYTGRPFPAYRYLPFRKDPTRPHPRNDPGGHSFDQEDEYLAHFLPEDWQGCELYLYAIDLFNYGYWWEAHEALETLWHAAGQKSTLCGRFIQGLIQLAGAQLKRYMAELGGAQSLTRAGSEKIALVEGIYLGIPVATLLAEVNACLEEDKGVFPRIELHFQVRPFNGRDSSC